MSDLFKTLVNGTEKEQEQRRNRPNRQQQRDVQRANREEQERLNMFPKLIQEKRQRERLERIAEQRRESREYYSLPNRIKRVWTYLWT
jgi:hypothetical protein